MMEGPVTIIGISLPAVNFELIPVSLQPLGNTVAQQFAGLST
jgi:uncharacterized membrane protein YccF (DUF307 family)